MDTKLISYGLRNMLVIQLIVISHIMVYSTWWPVSFRVSPFGIAYLCHFPVKTQPKTSEKTKNFCKRNNCQHFITKNQLVCHSTTVENQNISTCLCLSHKGKLKQSRNETTANHENCVIIATLSWVTTHEEPEAIWGQKRWERSSAQLEPLANLLSSAEHISSESNEHCWPDWHCLHRGNQRESISYDPKTSCVRHSGQFLDHVPISISSSTSQDGLAHVIQESRETGPRRWRDALTVRQVPGSESESRMCSAGATKPLNALQQILVTFNHFTGISGNTTPFEIWESEATLHILESRKKFIL